MNSNKLILIDYKILSDQILNQFHIDSVYTSIENLSYEYPNFKEWYYNKVVNGLYLNERKILIYLENDIICGIAILKDTVAEKKICTIRVHPFFRRQGIGKTLIENSFELLQTAKPIITVSSARIDQFIKILNYFDFKLEMKFKGFYMPNVTEYVFNGDLKIKNGLGILRDIDAKSGKYNPSVYMSPNHIII